MPRNYVRKTTPSYTEDTLLSAMAEVEKGGTIYSTARKFGIPNETLRRWMVNRPAHLGPGRTSFLTTNEELCIVEALKFLAKCGFPFDRKNVLKLVETYLEVNSTGKKSLFPNKKPGIEWIRGFENRWKTEIGKRKPEILTKARAADLCSEIIRSPNDNNNSDVPPTQPEEILQEKTRGNMQHGGLLESPFKDLKQAILTTLSPSVSLSRPTKRAIENSRNKRKRVQSKTGEVLTESDVLTRLAEENEARLTKRKQNGKKRCKANGIEPNTSNTVDLSLRKNHSQLVHPNQLKQGSWVIAEYSTKKQVSQFIGQITEKLSDDLFNIKFLAKSKIGSYYIFPEVEDEDTVDFRNIVRLLQEPNFNNRGHYSFIL